jgi:hypothetical protein
MNKYLPAATALGDPMLATEHTQAAEHLCIVAGRGGSIRVSPSAQPDRPAVAAGGSLAVPARGRSARRGRARQGGGGRSARR